MDKDMKGILGEIFVLVLFLVIAVPLCVKASSDYQENLDKMNVGSRASVDISNCGEIKKVMVSSDQSQKMSVYLILKISSFDDEYVIYLDDKIFNLGDLEYSFDGEYRHYNLGLYLISGKRNFDFRIAVRDKSYYNETITYSFYTRGIF